jgi:hypothetical protein
MRSTSRANEDKLLKMLRTTQLICSARIMGVKKLDDLAVIELWLCERTGLRPAAH